MIETTQNGHAGGSRRRASLGLVCEATKGFLAGADENQVLFPTALRKIRALGHRPVTRVHRIATRRDSNPDHLLDVVVSAHPRAADLHGLVRLSRVQRSRVVLRIYRHGGDVELRRRPNDPDGDFPSIRYQQLHLNPISLVF